SVIESALAPDPEIRLAGDAEARRRTVVLVLAHLHDQDAAERRQGLDVKRLRTLIVGYRKPHVVDHPCLRACMSENIRSVRKFLANASHVSLITHLRNRSLAAATVAGSGRHCSLSHCSRAAENSASIRAAIGAGSRPLPS